MARQDNQHQSTKKAIRFRSNGQCRFFQAKSLFAKCYIGFCLLLGACETISVVGKGISTIIPWKLEESLGRNSYEKLNQSAFEPTRLSLARQQSLQRKTRRMIEIAKLDRKPTLHLHYSEKIGINALAFPGGPIVLTDALVEAMENDDQIMAVVAHELAHVEERHSMQRMIGILGLAVIARLVTDKNEGAMIAVAAAIATNMLTLKHSRANEKDADLKGLRIMREYGLDKTALIGALTALRRASCKDAGKAEDDCLSEHQNDWFSTHPGFQQRMAYLRAA